MIEVLQFALSTNLGGIETYLKKIWDNIDREQFHFSFIDMTGDGKVPCYYDYFTQSGCPFFKVTPRHISPIQNRKDLARLFSEHHFDILHFSANTLSYMLPVTMALKVGTKVIVHSRCAAIPNGRLTQIMHRLNAMRLRKMPVQRIAVSKQAGEWMFKGSEYKVYPNRIDPVRFTFSEESRAKIRSELNCADKTVIGHVGTFITTKNHVFVLRVFEAYHAKHPDSVLWLVGEGQLKEQIRDQVNAKGLEDAVYFLGRRDDMETVYAGMDFFLFPSIYEGLGNVVLEAQAEGLPCIISAGIPQETLIAANALSKDLGAPVTEWVEAVDELLDIHLDRKDGSNRIRNAGWSVQEEVVKLQALYVSTYNTAEA